MIAETVNQFKILKKLGEGGMGEVYLAEDTNLDRKVALKFLPPYFSKDPEVNSRFKREAKAAAALNHPNIITIHEIGEHEGRAYIAMEYVEGKSLRERISDADIQIEEALGIIAQICNGLEQAHEAGIVHRDLKPENILLDDNGMVRILDFGLAKFSGQSKLTVAGTTLGTVAYMSPEQARGDEVGPATDIWSLGIVFYEILTGETPFKNDYVQAIIYSIMSEDPHFSEKVTQFPNQLVELLEKSLQKDISIRTASASDFKMDLQKFQSQLLGSNEKGKSRLNRYLRPAMLIPIGLVVLLASLLLVRQIYRSSQTRWSEDVALSQIEYLAAESWAENLEAFELAVEAEKYIPDHPRLRDLMKLVSGTLSIISHPTGAKVYRKPFDKPEIDWEFIGTTPIPSKRMPYYLYRWKIEKPGYETLYRASWTGRPIDWTILSYPPDTLECLLDKSGSLPANMVRIPGTGEIDDFFIDKNEVTNQEFKGFIENNGYRNKAYWKHPFVTNGKKLSFEEAMSEFKDTTGRLAPATWEGGSYPEGEDDYPVSGVSWYEAAAYAEFVGKSLPTVSHWGAARRDLRYSSHFFIPLSNFGGKGPVAIGTTDAMTLFGVYDMAGNVREWCWNASELGRCIRGGA